MEARQPQRKRYTYADYKQWPEDFRCELIDGEVVMMSPGPTPPHQRVKGRLFSKLDVFLDGKTCVPFDAPTDVLLLEEDENEDDADTVLQPDILVICDPGKIGARGIVGAPDLVIEVLSPGTTQRDLNIKKYKYEHYGVREYWIVSPKARMITQFKRIDGVFEGTDIIKGRIDSSAVEGFGFELEELFSVLDIFDQPYKEES